MGASTGYSTTVQHLTLVQQASTTAMKQLKAPKVFFDDQEFRTVLYPKCTEEAQDDWGKPRSRMAQPRRLWVWNLEQTSAATPWDTRGWGCIRPPPRGLTPVHEQIGIDSFKPEIREEACLSAGQGLQCRVDAPALPLTEIDASANAGDFWP